MRIQISILAVLLVTGCQKVAEEGLKPAEHSMELNQPKQPPCGGRYLTEAELKKLIVGSSEGSDHYKIMYQANGIISEIKENRKVNKFGNYAIVGSSLCTFGSNIDTICNFYAVNKKYGIYRINIMRPDFPTPPGSKIQYDCNKFESGNIKTR